MRCRKRRSREEALAATLNRRGISLQNLFPTKSVIFRVAHRSAPPPGFARPRRNAEQGQRAVNHLRRLDPALRISNLDDWLPIRRPTDRATFAEGLRRAGLPE